MPDGAPPPGGPNPNNPPPSGNAAPPPPRVPIAGRGGGLGGMPPHTTANPTNGSFGGPGPGRGLARMPGRGLPGRGLPGRGFGLPTKGPIPVPVPPHLQHSASSSSSSTGPPQPGLQSRPPPRPPQPAPQLPPPQQQHQQQQAPQQPQPQQGPPQPGGALQHRQQHPPVAAASTINANKPSPAAATTAGPGASAPLLSEGGGGGKLRELKVEDALLYLDEVKREFGDRPRIYNEFLEIMKSFKSQSIDTPGVIRRVSNLFRGYNNLILGFNTFLPEGYKIELKDLVEHDQRLAAAEAASLNGSGRGADPPGQIPVRLTGPPRFDQQQQTEHQHQQQQQQQQQHQHQHQQAQQQRGQPPLFGGQQQQQQPHAAGTTARVQQQHMLKPDGATLPVNITLPGNKSASLAAHSSAGRGSGMSPFSQQQDQPASGAGRGQKTQGQKMLRPGPQGKGLEFITPQNQGPQQMGAPPQQDLQHQRIKAQLPPTGQQEQQQQQQQQQQQHQQQGQAGLQDVGGATVPSVEFDHAITYVTTIKRRFSNQPDIYSTFLRILHTYQKEQQGIKEVLERVSTLFADHPDLLKEFTFFLPDCVQEQAKERLHRAAAESEARQVAAAAARQAKQQPTGFKLKGQQRHDPSEPQFARRPISMQGSQKLIDMTMPHQGGSSSEMGIRSQAGPGSALQTASPRKGVSPGEGRTQPFSSQVDVSAVPPTAVAPMIQHPPQPESYVYNAGVERQFFDSAKEALTAYSRDGGQGWAEFLKCMDMYAQEVLSRTEMLELVEPLLGKRNAELFEEFKRILGAAGAPTAPCFDDAWHSVPLSEIDFSRCRQCSPSYRALPRDYPLPPCSERNDFEKKVLNNVWVSLPVGSEESYTFRHMRKNQYEEVLFRTEDERFEIDMVIDTNAATLRRLEPIAEEIATLKQRELYTSGLMDDNLSDRDGTSNLLSGKKRKSKSSSRPCPSAAGLGGKIFQYNFDKRIMGVIHRNTITRIYGEAGQEMLELLYKNPTMAIPILVNRLRQKDREWKAARIVLNQRWKELAEVNYYRSLDHRSLTWRTTDKRATSTRTLLAEIKDRAAHGGNEGATSLMTRREKAKEEHGSFFEKTMGKSFFRKNDLTNLPKPTKSLFTPHLSLQYENNSWAQRDAYRIIAFALERGAISPGDKERCHRLWKSFLGPFFGLTLNWMLSPAVAFSASPSLDVAAIVSNGEESGNEDDESSNEDTEIDRHNKVTEEFMKARDITEQDNGLLDHQPIPAGAQVSTLFGEGTIEQYRRGDQTYTTTLPFGTAYLRPNAVLCTVLPVEKSSTTDQFRRTHKEEMERADDMIAMGTQSLYLFFRLHQVLVRRLNIAKHLAYKVSEDKSLKTLVEKMSPDDDSDVGRKRYEAYLSLVYALVEGSYSSSSQGSSAGAAEGGRYEDRVRCLLGHGAYELATMDKLISHILKNLQSMGNDETLQNMVQLFQRHLDTGSFKPMAFRQEAALYSEGENMFAFQYCKIPKSDRTIMHFEFLGVITEEVEGEESSIHSKKDNGSTTDVVMAEAEEGLSVVEGPVSKRPRRIT